MCSYITYILESVIYFVSKLLSSFIKLENLNFVNNFFWKEIINLIRIRQTYYWNIYKCKLSGQFHINADTGNTTLIWVYVEISNGWLTNLTRSHIDVRVEIMKAYYIL